ncbi:hypothetical protein TrLO_g13435 [Triparma laevis f. longispina]|uniref:Uncharacterized protein n=1 Tax=Triparma laevis f. longispina TaxID=1714387 RepID=A0A9W7L104_9STRA|nr:hypothetical protein TrLO_g13435 [Triparma laevis f. longispina]
MYCFSLILLVLLILVHSTTSFTPRITTRHSTTPTKLSAKKRKIIPPPTPPTIRTPYGPIQPPLVKIGCLKCSATGLSPCPTCSSTGLIINGRLKNANNLNILPPKNKLIDTRFTSVNVLNGHRHYRIKSLLGDSIILENSCGESKEVIQTKNELKNKSIWRSGWVTLEEIRKAEGGALQPEIKTCFRCKGMKKIECETCYGEGEIYRDAMIRKK